MWIEQVSLRLSKPSTPGQRSTKSFSGEYQVDDPELLRKKFGPEKHGRNMSDTKDQSDTQ